MESLNRMLVASDLSAHADQAIARAVRLAREHTVALTVLNVVEHVVGENVPPENLVKLLIGAAGEVVPALKQRAAQALRAKVDALPAPVPAEVAVRVGPAFLEIIRQARETAADFVVLGAHGGHFVKRWALGTTAERVVRKGDRPVLVVRKAPRGPYRHLLAAMDFSDTAKAALRFALRVAPKARVTLLHAYDLSQVAAPAIDRMTGEDFRRLRAEFESDQRARLMTLAGELGFDPEKAASVVRYGYPGQVIKAAIADVHADLVVIGTRGLAGLRHLLLGSVAEHVLRGSPCDVLVAPPAVVEFALP